MTKNVKKRKTKTEKLLKFIEKKGEVTREEITRFLLGGKRGVDNYNKAGYYFGNVRKTAPDYWKAQLFGTSARAGLLGRFLKKTKDGKFKLNKRQPVNEPFYPFL